VTAFHVCGGLFALWAITVAVLGITREGFPGSRGGARMVGAISVVLALCAIGSAIYVGATEKHEKGGAKQAVLPGT
jgi:hypothetical protein